MRLASCIVAAAIAACGTASALDVRRAGNSVLTATERFTVLSPTLLRMEHAPDGRFVDCPSIVAVNRHWQVNEFVETMQDGMLEIRTSRLRLTYRLGSGGFSPVNLHVEMPGTPVRWHPEMRRTAALGGTKSGLDGVGGPVQLEPGILNRDGWHLHDDTLVPVFDEQGWPEARDDLRAQDYYFFGYGHDYFAALADFNNLSGPMPMPPRWAFGTWLSLTWPRSGDELIDLIAAFRDAGLPLDALAVEDWFAHGWTSYDWHQDRFPDPGRFLARAHDLGVKVGLLAHPGGALLPKDSRYRDVVDALGWDPRTRGMIFFDIGSRQQATALARILLAPLERQGADFWWVDGAAANTIRHLGNQLWTSRLFFGTEEPPANQRPIILARYGGLGSQRFPVGFSGNFKLTWDLLRFLPKFTADAGNAGMVYWSHNIGGSRIEADPELFERLVQFGAISPILRLHSDERTIPWLRDERLLAAVRRFAGLRRSLAPYLYTLAREAHDLGRPLCRPMYLHYPDLPEAFGHDGQYLLGENLLAAPVTRPSTGLIGQQRREIWFPPGGWHDIFTGRTVQGPITLSYPVRPDHAPIFARTGAIIPRTPPGAPAGESVLALDVYSGAPGQFVLYEDDGASLAYRHGGSGRTAITYYDCESCRLLDIGGMKPDAGNGGVRGDFDGKPEQRTWLVNLVSFLPIAAVQLNGEALPQVGSTDTAVGWTFLPQRGIVSVRTPPLPASAHVEIAFEGNFSPERRDLAYRLHEVIPRLESAVVFLEESHSPRELIVAVRAAVEQADKASVAACCAPVETAELRRALADVRSILRRLVSQADRILGDAAKMEFVRIVTGVRFDSEIVPSRFREAIVRTTVRHLPYGWGAVSGSIRVEDRPARQFGPVEPRGLVSFDEDLAIQTLLLDELVFNVRAELDWNGTPISFTLVQKLDNTFVKQCYALGPLGNGGYRRMMEVEFPPEERIELGASYQGKDGREIYWRKLPWEPPVPQHGGRDLRAIDLGRGAQRSAPATGYALVYVYVPQTTQARLLLGGEGGLVVWVNSIEVYRNTFMRHDRPDEEEVATRFRAGWNTMLMKSIDEGNLWGFFLRIVGEDRRPIFGARTGWGPGFEAPIEAAGTLTAAEGR